MRVVADSAAFDRAISKLGDNTSKSLVAGTRGLSARAADIGERFGSSIGRVAGTALKRGLQVAAVGVAAAVGVTLAKGFKRFTTIQDATASLTLQLGSAQKAADLLGKTLKVVEGTPFALDQFVGAAQNLVAANIDLEKIPRVLTAIGDAAAATGGSAEAVDSVVSSFGRIATGAQLTLGPIRELEEKGVPALRILANQAGKSANDMAKDITKGSVDSKEAIDDLVDGILNGTDGINGATRALGGSSKLLGQQVSGAFANMQTAVARAGARIIAVFAESGKSGTGLVDILGNLTETIDVLGLKGEELAKRFVEGEGFDRILKFFEELPDKVEKGLKSLEGKEFGDVFAGLLIRGIEGIAKNAALITAAIIKAAPSIAAGVAKGLFEAFKRNPLNVGLLIAAMGLPGIGPVVTAFLTGLFRALPGGAMIAPLIRNLGLALQKGFALLFGRLGLATAVRGLLPALSSAFAGLGTAVVGFLSSPAVLVAAGASIGLLASFLVSKIGGLAETIIKTLLAINPATRLIAFMAEGFNNGFPALFSTVIGFFSRLPGQIVSAASSIVGLLGSLGSSAMRAMGGAVSTGIQAVLGFFSRLPGQVGRLLAGIPGQLSRLASSALSAMVSAVSRGISNVVSLFRGLPGQISSAVGSLGGLLVSAGRSVINGFVNAAQAAWNARKGFFNTIGGFIQRNKGPLDKDFKLLQPAGDAIMQGFDAAIRRNMGMLANTLADVTGLVGGGVPIGRFPTQAAARATTTPAVPSGLIQNITVVEAVDGQSTAEAVAMRLGRMVNT